VDLDGVDEREGQKIVGHVFGDQRGQVVQQLGTTRAGPPRRRTSWASCCRSSRRS
jgi:hypothetical protein